jgi:Flp pilus assembly protein TadG
MAVRQLLRRRERGAVAILLTVLLGTGVLLGVAALVIDVGNLYAERGQLQNGADAAAMVVANDCAAGSCDDTEGVDGQWAPAQKYANANAKDGHTLVTDVCGSWGKLPTCPAPAAGLAACVGSPPSGKYVEVRVRTLLPDGSRVLPPIFASAMAGKSGYQGKSLTTCSRAAESCVTAAKETYHHTFVPTNAYADATITADKPLCPGESQPVTLVSYTAQYTDSSWPQWVYYTQSGTVTASTRSLSFHVNAPACYTQIDYVFRAAPIDPLDNSEWYGSDKLGDSSSPGNRSTGPNGWYHGGSADCDPQPTESFAATCTGLQVKITNEPAANVDAVVVVTDATGASQRKHVAPGGSGSVTVAAANASTVTVRDNNTLATMTGHWTRPGGC